MTGTRVDIDGADRLTQTLGQAADRLPAIAPPAAAQIVAARARQLAPVRTGVLAASIAPVIREGAVEVSAGTEYAAVQEYGSRARNIPAQPFMRPALEETQAQIAEAYTAEVGAILAEVKGA